MMIGFPQMENLLFLYVMPIKLLLICKKNQKTKNNFVQEWRIAGIMCMCLDICQFGTVTDYIFQSGHMRSPFLHTLLMMWYWHFWLGGDVYITILGILGGLWLWQKWCYVTPKARSSKTTKLPLASLRALVLGIQPLSRGMDKSCVSDLALSLSWDPSLLTASIDCPASEGASPRWL